MSPKPTPFKIKSNTIKYIAYCFQHPQITFLLLSKITSHSLFHTQFKIISINGSHSINIYTASNTIENWYSFPCVTSFSTSDIERKNCMPTKYNTHINFPSLSIQNNWSHINSYLTHRLNTRIFHTYFYQMPTQHYC